MTSPSEEMPSVSEKTIIESIPRRAKVPTVLQQAAVECGAASLGMVLASMGRFEPLDTLRAAAGVTRDGASAISIMRAAQQYGLETEPRRGEVADLNGIPVPAIVWVNRSHFVVLEGAHRDTFFVNDPARGRYSLSTEEFSEIYSGAAMSFSKNENFTAQGHPFRAGPALWQRIKLSQKGVQFAIFAGILAMLFGLMTAPVSQIFINDVLGASQDTILPELIAILLSIGIFRGGLTILEYGVISRLEAKLALVGTTGFVQRLMKLPLGFFYARSIGDLSQRVSYNSSIASLLASQMASAGIALLAAMGYAFLLFYYNWIIGLVVLGLSFLNVLTLRLVMNFRTRVQGRVIRRQNELRGTTTASIQGIETIKSTGMESDVFKSLTGQQADYITAAAALVPSSALLASTPVFLFALTSASILVLGGWSVIAGTLTIGGLLAISALAANLNNPIQTLMATGSQIQVVTSSLRALEDVLANETDDRFERSPLDSGSDFLDYTGSVRLENVSFGYGDQAPLIIEDFSLELKPGHRVALVGGSGSGKTTIANLLAGLYPPRTGQVLYDEKPLSDYPEGALESYISKVDQNIVLFEGTVRENVGMWDLTLPSEHIEQALEDAQILNDILARDQGIDCFVSENGRNFSGGQCQRIEIARALALNPRLIVLDEATSALDDITEKLVDEALRRRGMSCVIVAHRLSTIRDADEIIVLGPGGAVLERGNHELLMAAQGPYQQMVLDSGEGGNVGS